MLKVDNKIEDCDIPLLLERFNNRECIAFSRIYSLLYNDLHYFATSLYATTEIEACDVIHDAFVRIWNNKKLKFEDILNIKGYLVISIKNGFKNYICHKKYVEEYKNDIKQYDDNFFVANIAEMETFSTLTQINNILPEECSRVFKLYFDGWSVKDIAEKLCKAESTVYSQKNEAIRILKRKMFNTFL